VTSRRWTSRELEGERRGEDAGVVTDVRSASTSAATSPPTSPYPASLPYTDSTGPRTEGGQFRAAFPWFSCRRWSGRRRRLDGPAATTSATSGHEETPGQRRGEEWDGVEGWRRVDSVTTGRKTPASQLGLSAPPAGTAPLRRG
jgi:hypothetical protein